MINQQFKMAILLLVLLNSVTGLAYAGDKSTPKRIVTAGGSITEIMYALGLEKRVIGIDTSSNYPPRVSALPKVGYYRGLAAEGIMSLNPDMLVVAKGAGPEVVLKQIKSLGVKVKAYEQSQYTQEAWAVTIKKIGSDFNRPKAATNLINSVFKGIENYQNTRHFEPKRINAITLLSVGQRGPIAAGRNTVPNFLMSLAGINNAAVALDGYKPFSTELLAEQKVDMVLVPSHIADGLGGKEAICANQIIKMATSNKCNLFVMDGLLLMGFGARLDQAIGEIIRFANGV